MSFAQNLIRLLKSNGIDQSELSRRLGVTSQAVNQWCSGETRPRGKRLNSIADALGIAVTELLCDYSDENQIPIRSLSNAKDRGSFPIGDIILIPEIAVQPQAGHGASQPELDANGKHVTLAEWRMPADFIGKNLSSSRNLVIIEVNGDSMSPEYNHGDKVLVDMSFTRPSPPGIYILWDGLGLVLKCVELLMGRTPPTLRLKSLNTDYADYECLLSEARINGRVVGKWVWK